MRRDCESLYERNAEFIEGQWYVGYKNGELRDGTLRSAGRFSFDWIRRRKSRRDASGTGVGFAWSSVGDLRSNFILRSSDAGRDAGATCVFARLDFGCGVINDPIVLSDCVSCACLKLLKI